MPFAGVVPPEELVEPPEDEPPDDEPPDDEVEPPDDEVDPPDEEVEPPLLVLLAVPELPPELDADGSVPVPVAGGSVPFVSVPRSEAGLAKSSFSFAPPQAARRAIDEATAAQRIRRGFMAVAKH